jgi:adenylate cyclase
MRKILIGLAIGAGAALLGWTLSLTDLADRTEAGSYDLRLRATAPPTPADTPIVLVEINESSIREFEAAFGRWPWPRIAHAVLIDFLKSAGARVIAYDVFFGERDTRGDFDLAGQRFSGAGSDEALVNSVRAAGNVILLADATYDGLASATTELSRTCTAPDVRDNAFAPGPGFQDVPCVDLPFDGLAAAAAGFGHNYASVEPVAHRRLDPFVVSQDVPVPALGLAAAVRALGARPESVTLDAATRVLSVGDRRLPLHLRPGAVSAATRTPPPDVLKALLWFRRPHEAGGTRTTYPAYSFFDVLLSGDQIATGKTPAIDPAVFRDKVVFVGATAAGLFDTVQTPFEQDGTGGMYLHATLADGVLSAHAMRRAETSLEVGLTIAAGLVIGLIATTIPAGWATPLALALLGVLAWALTRGVAGGVWIAGVPPMLAGALALFGGVAWQYFVEGRARREVRALFGRFVSNDVIAQLEANPARATLGGERRTMTVLFSDIRGFTTATEKGEPEAVVEQLNQYFSAMVDVLFRHRGTLDKFVGDMVMGLFGAPLDDPRHADHAVAAAREMVAELARLNERWTADGRPTVDIGIGINTGEMVVGNIGSEAIMSYTVIGDAVNLGARLESLNKEYGTHILISDATRAALTMPVETRHVADVIVKGKTRPVTVYEVT